MAGKEDIVLILIKRDNMDRLSAEDLVDDVISQIEACNYNYDEAERILMDDLCLEPDYLIYLI